jgi:hypothetical protein
MLRVVGLRFRDGGGLCFYFLYTRRCVRLRHTSFHSTFPRAVRVEILPGVGVLLDGDPLELGGGVVGGALFVVDDLALLSPLDEVLGDETVDVDFLALTGCVPEPVEVDGGVRPTRDPGLDVGPAAVLELPADLALVAYLIVV